ncbi:MAG TPA: glutamate--tRNA ligase [Acidimicrobiia bacterium]|nr:glutamate--tRNA ligase [Acidimicrobiia bacterium]
MAPVRVRFSPAPTGELHVGGARTALCNLLFARGHGAGSDGATFLLRIEDTDRARVREEWVDGIQDTLHWLSIGWDGQPIRQSEHVDRYVAVAEQFLADGLAYECFCTEDDVKERNATARAAGRPPGYDGHCRDLTTAERDERRAEGRASVLRFRTPDTGVSTFRDLIRGDVTVEWANIPDFVILRSDRSPIFFLANAVDDLDEGITHVIRGEDLIDTTHRVLVLRRAMGAAEQPIYAHLPLILAADRSKLSKRHGSVAVEEFRSRGILPEALLNYLALLGWSPDEAIGEILSLAELIEHFDLEHVTHASAVFDEKKLEWINGEWMRRLDTAELAARVEPEVRERFGAAFDPDVFAHAVAIGQERSSTLVQLVDQMACLFVADDDLVIEPEAWARLEAVERADDVLDAVIAHVEACEWTVDGINLVEVIKQLGLKPGKVMAAVYVAIEGRAQGLPVFDAIWLIGQEHALNRLRAARDRLG